MKVRAAHTYVTRYKSPTHSPPGDLGPTVVPPPSAASVVDAAGASSVDINAYPRPSVTRKAKVLYDYDASDKGELSLLADEVSAAQSIG